MTIIATKEFQSATFTWTGENSLDTCTIKSYGISTSELNSLVKNKVNEGCDYDGWNIEIL